MEKLTPESLREILLLLQESQLEIVIVGGQAVNLWAYQYIQDNPQLQNYIPFASEDLDFYGGRVEASICQEILGGKLILNRDFDPSPNAGVLLIDYQERQLRIDFLASVYGLNDSEITGTALTFEGKDSLAGLRLKVLHPVLCFEGKLRCLRGLPQQGRQDLKHVKISLLCVQALLIDIIHNDSSRMGLKLVERVLKNAIREDGLSAWYRHNIDIISAIPLEIISQLNDEKWQKFSLIRLPKIIEQIHTKRNRYLTITNRQNG
jgi:hypothetical protein